MKERTITAVLAGASILLAAAAGAKIYTADREAPVIRFEGKNDLVYTEGDSYEELLQGVTAEDETDGDVTESVRVSSITVTEENRALVVYVAKDEANHVAKLKRMVHYRTKAEEETTDPSEKKEESSTQNNKTTTAEKRSAQSQKQQTDQEGPKLTFLQNEAKLKVGESFNLLRYIESAVDTDGSDLSRFIHVSGNYDMTVPGVYTLSVYAANADGETSNVEEFTLTVE